MKRKPTRGEKMSDAFLVFGSQYYILARYCAEHMYLPVSVTLFHHAIEMLIKGYLSKSKTSAELKKAGHDLSTLWKLYKKEASNNELAKFDTTISRLNEVELLRYPDKIVEEGYILNVRLGTPIPVNIPGTENLPQYFVNVSELDDIAISIFKACKVAFTPYFKNAPTLLINSLPSTLRPVGE